MTEQQKYLDALRKAEDFKRAFVELSPARREQLAKTVLHVSSLQEALAILRNMLFPNGRM